MIHLVLLLSLPLAVVANLKAVAYGQISSAETLFPAPKPTNVDHFLSNGSEKENEPVYVTWSDQSDQSSFTNLEDVVSNDEPGFHEDLDTDPADSNHSTPSNSTEGKILERRDFLRSGVPSRVGKFGGTMQIDCHKAVEVCRNAGYYQNCLKGAAGNNQWVKYYNWGYDSQFAVDNRLNSGVTTDLGTPCNAWPFAQRFWHPQFAPGKPNVSELQTDEWPMATMYNEEFDEHARSPHVSLRCMKQNENGYGSTARTNFRSCKGPYNTDTTSKSYKKYKAMWGLYREGDCKKTLAKGDWLYVNFNLDAFPKKITDPADQAKWDKLDVVKGPWPAACTNDGFQFHLSALRKQEAGKSWKGALQRPYDSLNHNAYRLVKNDGTDKNLKQFHITLTIRGQNRERLTVNESHRYGGQFITLLQVGGPLQPGQAIVTQGQLPSPLRIQRIPGCDLYKFDYGDPRVDRLRWFAFQSDNKGLEIWQEKDSRKKKGAYCHSEPVPATDSSGRKLEPGEIMKCSFPSW